MAKKDEPIDIAALRADEELIEKLTRGEDLPNSELNKLLEAYRDETWGES